MALGRVLAATTALALIAACGTVESAGRNARDGAAPAPPVTQSAPPPVTQSAPPPTQQTAPPPPSAAAPGVSVAQPAPQAEQRSGGGGDIVVPGQVERQVPVPEGDPRSAGERMADIRAWDRCVMQVQGQAASDPMRPALETPEDVCRNDLGMANRTAVPASRR